MPCSYTNRRVADEQEFVNNPTDMYHLLKSFVVTSSVVNQNEFDSIQEYNRVVIVHLILHVLSFLDK